MYVGVRTASFFVAEIATIIAAITHQCLVDAQSVQTAKVADRAFRLGRRVACQGWKAGKKYVI